MLEWDKPVRVGQIFAGAKGEAISEAKGGKKAEATGGLVAK